jgi:hypothetical protein
MRVRNRYLDRVIAAGTANPAAAEAYARVLGLLARPTSLFAPRILAAAARAHHAVGVPATALGVPPAPGASASPASGVAPEKVVSAMR